MESFFASAAADSVGSACVLLLVVLAYKLYKVRLRSNCHNDFCDFSAAILIVFRGFIFFFADFPEVFSGFL